MVVRNDIRAATANGAHRETACASCLRVGTDRIPCACGQALCEACYDRAHQDHDERPLDDGAKRAIGIAEFEERTVKPEVGP